jgi:hypothetical protein
VSVASGSAERPSALGWPRTLGTGVLAAAAAISVVALLALVGSDRLGWDFRYTYVRAASLVLDGESPYPPLDNAVIGSGTAYVYPPQLAVVLAPVTALPDDVVVGLAFLGAVAALMGSLALLGIRDPLCYAAVLAWAPVSSALEATNLNAFLALAAAAAWRFRHTVWPLASVLGLAISTKLFLWPLAVWALAAGRHRALVRAIVLGVAVTFGAWAAIGFADLTRYTEILSRFSEVQGEENSYSILAAATSLGLAAPVGHVLALASCGALLAVCFVLARRDPDSERAFVAAIGAALAVTPVAWLHAYALLVVPLALARPRFSVLWLLPILLWVCPRGGNGEPVQTLLPVVVAGVIVVSALVVPDPRRPAQPA